jgi:AcrR family transcriptional regulator
VSEVENVRVTRTRRALFDAAEALMAEQDEPITVSDVLRRAGVSRGAFYTHFTGLEDLAVAMFRDRFSELSRDDVQRRAVGSVSAAESSFLAIRDVVQHVVDHRALYLGVETLTGGRRAHETLVDLLYEVVHATVLAVPTRPPEVVTEDIARFTAGGSMALLVDWMRAGERPDVDEMTRRLLALQPAWGQEP